MRRTRAALLPQALIVFYLFNMMENANQTVAAEIKHTLWWPNPQTQQPQHVPASVPPVTKTETLNCLNMQMREPLGISVMCRSASLRMRGWESDMWCFFFQSHYSV